MPSTHTTRPVVPIAVLVSGRGSNLEAILEAIDKKYITNGAAKVVISNRPDAPALDIARKHNVPAKILDDHGLPKKSWEYDQRTIRLLQEHGVKSQDGLILLSGYFRILTPEFVGLYERRILNIHPALLPAFPGLNAQKQALDHGAKVTGCTVHFVDKGVDTGPIILQTPVPVRDDDTVETLSQRILREEHRLYPEAVRLFTDGMLTVKERRVLLVE
ncbi:phosphoribosylglycinamide formyltransferase [Candidatus Bathyarchaeota archaeon]|nr:MAG: phosphoribosylglycinamide formyltransferase [Candidatus Bathyarchaeota archaeon]